MSNEMLSQIFLLVGPRQQQNTQTALIDGSVIYGPTPAIAERFRANSGGLLITQVSHCH